MVKIRKAKTSRASFESYVAGNPAVRFWLEFTTLFILVHLSSDIGKRVRKLFDQAKVPKHPMSASFHDTVSDEQILSKRSESHFESTYSFTGDKILDTDILDNQYIPSAVEVFDDDSSQTALIAHQPKSHQDLIRQFLKNGATSQKIQHEPVIKRTTAYHPPTINLTIPLPLSTQITKPTNSSLIILVLSKRTNFEIRNTIRNTWAKNKTNVFFVVGKACPFPVKNRLGIGKLNHGKELQCVPKSGYNKRLADFLAPTYAENIEKERLLLVQESRDYQDIIFVKMFDVYRKLVRKVKMAHQYLNHHYKEFEWAAKVDDDMFVRVDALESFLEDKSRNLNPAEKMYLFGHFASLPIEKRDFQKNYEGDYFDESNKYPSFPVGSYGNIVSKKLSEYISENAGSLFEYQGEDVSLGIWMKYVDALKDVRKFEFYEKSTNKGAEACVDSGKLIIGHGLRITDQKRCQNLINNAP